VLPRAGDGLLLPLPPGLASQVTDGDRRLTEDDLGGLEITVRHRASGVEWPVAGSSSRQVIDDPDGAQLAVTSAAVLDPANLAFGAGLAAGTWDVLVREQFLGESITRRLPVPAQVSQPPGGRRLAARLTPKGTLAVVAAGPGQTLSQESGAAPTTSAVVAARWCGDTLHLRLDHGSRPDVPTAAVQQVELRRRDDGGPRVRAALRAVPGQGGPGQCEAGQGEAVLRLPDGERGQIWDGWLLAEGAESTRLRFEVPEVAQHRPYRVYRTAHGSFSIKQTAAGGNR
jgi:poly(ribitol-phosphate) beta-N-acetylglucosaminyltransferase